MKVLNNLRFLTILFVSFFIVSCKKHAPDPPKFQFYLNGQLNQWNQASIPIAGATNSGVFRNWYLLTASQDTANIIEWMTLSWDTLTTGTFPTMPKSIKARFGGIDYGIGAGQALSTYTVNITSIVVDRATGTFSATLYPKMANAGPILNITNGTFSDLAFYR